MSKINDKKSELITPEVINECLCESFGDIKKNMKSHDKNKQQLN